MKKKYDWPVWDLPDKRKLKELTKAITPFIQFISPEIVEAVVKDTQKNRKRWISKLKKKNVNPDIYLWDKSPCAFIGVRRHAGAQEISIFRSGKTNRKSDSFIDACYIDGNDYPKEIWAFTFLGKRFGKSGPKHYQLAHLVDHKSYHCRVEKELLGSFPIIENNFPYSGLYTSITNMCYIPSVYLRPTDFNFELRNLLQQKAFNLYKDKCNMYPYNLKIKSYPKDSNLWDINDFKWSDPVGDLNNIDEFLEYRYNEVEEILK